MAAPANRPIDTGSTAVLVSGLKVIRGGKVVLPGLDLTVPKGQTVGLLGPSGGGKSTLMRAIVGVQVVAGGTVTVLGQAAGSPGLRHRVGYMTQHPAVYEDLTVGENVAYFGALVGAGPEAVRRTIALVDLTGQTSQAVRRLSGGQRSRVSLAAALVGEPELLVLDEPTVGLDPVLRRDLWALFHELAAQGKTLLVSSHVMDEATRCDRLVLLHEGRVLADTTPAGLLATTGTDNAEAAFLALEAQAAQATADNADGPEVTP
ncbi:MAG: ABC transporter ATP-binding protein [Bifidobacteriaceae bacterium]|jgi:ABC-2 type transport system ATP-binding protein|nr:ABC transporter ATP-binding protein [Bifidobacteriaceae bacterium]